MKGVARSLAATCACALLFACSDSHGANAGTGGRDWLRCSWLVDCEGAKDAVACSAEGFCVDPEGERVAVDQGQLEPAGQAGKAGSAGSAALVQESCLSGTDALLAEIGLEAENRADCGSYASTDQDGFERGLLCYQSALSAKHAVELTREVCSGCNIVSLFLTTARGEDFRITRETAQIGAEPLTEISLEACERMIIMYAAEPDLDPAPGGRYPFIGCHELWQDRYRCRQPRDAPSRDAPTP